MGFDRVHQHLQEVANRAPTKDDIFRQEQEAMRRQQEVREHLEALRRHAEEKQQAIDAEEEAKAQPPPQATSSSSSSSSSSSYDDHFIDVDIDGKTKKLYNTHQSVPIGKDKYKIYFTSSSVNPIVEIAGQFKTFEKLSRE